MASDFRPITVDEFPLFVDCMATGFGFVPDPDDFPRRLEVTELDRSLAAFDGGEICATTGIFSFDLTLPGGQLPTAGVTSVSVRSTHRRQGLLRGMMQRQLADVKERGEALAALWASESIIYGRFGYGRAADTYNIAIDRRHTELAHGHQPRGSVRMVDRETALSAWPGVYDRVRAETPGMYTRSPAWWPARVIPAPDVNEVKGKAIFNAQYEEGGDVLGYIRYEMQGDWNNRNVPAGTANVRQLMAATPAAYEALWRYAFGIDLMDRISAGLRSTDEPLYAMLADPRRLERTPSDSLWLRITDVPAALTARRYSTEGRLVFDVTDALCGFGGRYVLEAGPEGATCRESDATPDLQLGIAELSAMLLGSVRAGTLARAGRIEGTAEALQRADLLFQWHEPAWCPEIF